ncbi:MAG: hypothetical protein HY043_07250 [Verrucomicrobia bacterium]|nr:hypothetical protein [Verrucomicrobiota bacterium]
MKFLTIQATRRYLVLFRGSGLHVPDADGTCTIVGFFTTRVVDGADDEQARARTRQSLMNDLDNQFCASELLRMSIEVDEVRKVSWWYRRFRSPSGFTFYATENKNKVC